MHKTKSGRLISFWKRIITKSEQIDLEIEFFVTSLEENLIIDNLRDKWIAKTKDDWEEFDETILEIAPWMENDERLRLAIRVNKYLIRVLGEGGA